MAEIDTRPTLSTLNADFSLLRVNLLKATSRSHPQIHLSGATPRHFADTIMAKAVLCIMEHRRVPLAIKGSADIENDLTHASAGPQQELII